MALGAARSTEVRGRGNSSWSWAKKPYKLKLEDDTRYLPYLYGGMEPKDALSRYEFTYKP